MEEVVYDDSGQLLTGSLMDYTRSRRRPASSARGRARRAPSTINALGIKGVGESGAIPGAAAIANAIEDAVADLGASILEVPVTPARLFAALAR